MAYLGNVPARSFISFERQVFTIVNSQTAYTLSHSVTNENDIRLVVNNVVQEPGSGKAYTATGTTLTLSAALTNGTDEMYCVFLGRATATNAPGAGSVGTSQLAADAVTNAKIADDAISDEQLDPTVITGQTAETSIATDDLILLSDTSASGALKKMTRANFVSGVGGVNTPMFEAVMSGNQALGNGSTTKIQFDTEKFDTNGDYDHSTNYRFTPTVAGKYQFDVSVEFAAGGSSLAYCYVYIYKNGSARKISLNDFQANPGNTHNATASYIIDMDGSSDYVEAYGHMSGAGNVLYNDGGSSSSKSSVFKGYKIIE